MSGVIVNHYKINRILNYMIELDQLSSVLRSNGDGARAQNGCVRRTITIVIIIILGSSSSSSSRSWGQIMSRSYNNEEEIATKVIVNI